MPSSTQDEPPVSGNAEGMSQPALESLDTPSSPKQNPSTLTTSVLQMSETTQACSKQEPPQPQKDLKKCWICFADESEDTPTTSAWRSPCPCALVAHEECLLDWIADLESSQKRPLVAVEAGAGGAGAGVGDGGDEGADLTAHSGRALLCPQCKLPITLQRPLDPIVEVVKALDRVAGQFVIPAFAVLTTSLLVKAFTAHGIHAITMLFGDDDARTILGPLIEHMSPFPTSSSSASSPSASSSSSLAASSVGDLRLPSSRLRGDWDLRDFWDDFRAHWRLYTGIPLITPTLLLSRTRLVDNFLPLLPLVYFGTESVHAVRGSWDGNDTSMSSTALMRVLAWSDRGSGTPRSIAVSVPSWPPSAAFAFSLLPYVRAAYCAYYRKVWAPRIAKWDKMLEPRAGRNGDGGDEDRGGDINGRGNGNMGAQGGINDDNDDDEHLHDNEAVFELRLDANIFPNWGGNPDPPPPPPPQQQQRQEQREEQGQQQQEARQGAPLEPGLADGVPGQQRQEPRDPLALEDPAVPDDQALAANPPVEQAQRDQRIAFNTIGLAEKLLGSLLFPTAAALAGQALLRILPESWTCSPALKGVSSSTTVGLLFKSRIDSENLDARRPTGLLQTRWGRSLVGGCLLVVFKDAVMLYVKWRMVQQHRQRKVLDYTGKPRFKT